jgi:hypothetical protein
MEANVQHIMAVAQTMDSHLAADAEIAAVSERVYIEYNVIATEAEVWEARVRLERTACPQESDMPVPLDDCDGDDHFDYDQPDWPIYNTVRHAMRDMMGG